MREDGDTPGLQFDNMQRRRVKGTRDWTEYSIVLPLHPDAKHVFFGFLIAGKGTAWVDDLQLLVDGKPMWEAPAAVPASTVLDTDKEFDLASSQPILTTSLQFRSGTCNCWARCGDF
jgi:hypothetical protein